MDSDSSSDSEDEFLTMGGSGQGNVDREALIRKKLLESFYGKSSVDDNPETGGGVGVGTGKVHHSLSDDYSTQLQQMTSTSGVETMTGSNMGRGSATDAGAYSEQDDGMSDGNTRVISTGPVTGIGSSSDLDSPNFDAEAHTSQHVIHSSVQTLLETEERLALQVRTLDSTMQTLVYENYSRFIDANDAIRSIGVNVQANEAGLARLSKGMQIVDEQSRAVEEDLGSLRDAVAEKIRVKRLLTRLDALLKLPKTLKEEISVGNYRKATKSYINATSILSKHSAGFESLKTIEVECKSILDQMLNDLKDKLLHWSGKKNTFGNLKLSVSASIDSDGDADADIHERLKINNHDSFDTTGREDEDSISPPELPKNIKEIFECAGTLTILLGNSSLHTYQSQNQQDADSGDAKTEVELDIEDCKSMSLLASVRFLDRLFDAHHLEMHEAAFGDDGSGNVSMSMSMNASASGRGFDTDSSFGNMGNSLSIEGETPASKGKNLIPTKVVDGILEAATLYRMTFGQHGQEHFSSDNSERNNDHVAFYHGNLIVDFVSEAFQSFLTHVRSILLERTVQLQRNVDAATAIDNDNIVQDDGEGVYEEISGAMSILNHCVRELASGLTLPEVGISADFASNLVDQTEDLTQEMVRRRVDQKFCELRLQVLQNCLVPFVTGATLQNSSSKPGTNKNDNANKYAEGFGSNNDENASGTTNVFQVVQMAGVALSDCLQLVDDTVRSIISGGNVLGSSTSTRVDLPVLKHAVELSTSRFAMWLAGTLEVLAGCEPSDPKVSFQAGLEDEAPDGSEQGDGENIKGANVTASSANFRDDMSEMSNHDDPITEKVDTVIQELLSEMDNKGTPIALSNLTLAICEMCRLGERSVVENMNQSIASHSGGEQKKSSGLFSSNENPHKPIPLSGKDKITSERFRLAASRIIGLFAMDRGFNGASILCDGMLSLGSENQSDGESNYDENTANLPNGPRANAWYLLEIAKQTSINCADLFGGSRRAGPVPMVDVDGGCMGSMNIPSTTAGLKHTSLQLDIERMFKEKISVYPHPSQMLDFTRNCVVTIVFKVAFKSLLEQTRRYSFSAQAYQQLQVDVEFLRHMIPHYVKDDFLAEGSNACSLLSNLLTDVMNSAGERCFDAEFVADYEYNTTTARSIVRDFMANGYNTAEGEEIISRFVIADDDEIDRPENIGRFKTN